MAFLAVLMATYNHEPYLRQSIESVMMQETPFSVKLYIGDDLSKDATRDICREMKEKYPEKIELFLNEKNLGPTLNGRQLYKAGLESDAKYMAILDGDDYWTDPLKLKKQVEFLESNSGYVLIGHAIKKINQKNEDIGTFSVPGTFEQHDLTKKYPISALSAVFTKAALGALPAWHSEVFNGDYALFSYILRHGKGYVMPEVMGVHRSHDGGVWAEKNSVYQAQNYFRSTDVMLKNNDFLTERSVKEILKKRKELRRDYQIYDKIGLGELLSGRLNFYAFLKYYVARFKSLIRGKK